MHRRSRQEDYQRDRNTHGTDDNPPHPRKNNNDDRGHQAPRPSGWFPEQGIGDGKGKDDINYHPAGVTDGIGRRIRLEDEQG